MFSTARPPAAPHHARTNVLSWPAESISRTQLMFHDPLLLLFSSSCVWKWEEGNKQLQGPLTTPPVCSAKGRLFKRSGMAVADSRPIDLALPVLVKVERTEPKGPRHGFLHSEPLRVSVLCTARVPHLVT